jgi:formylglycine-generating enzyme
MKGNNEEIFIPKIFISYSHKDSIWFDENYLMPRLAESLSVHAKAEIWWDQARIKGGDKWSEKIINAIDNANIAILLVSQNFLNSTFIKDEELPRLALRADTNQLKLFPILIGKCNWKTNPILSDRQMRPAKVIPLIKYHKSADEWDEVQDEIFQALLEQIDRIRDERKKSKQVKRPKTFEKPNMATEILTGTTFENAEDGNSNKPFSLVRKKQSGILLLLSLMAIALSIVGITTFFLHRGKKQILESPSSEIYVNNRTITDKAAGPSKEGDIASVSTKQPISEVNRHIDDKPNEMIAPPDKNTEFYEKTNRKIKPNDDDAQVMQNPSVSEAMNEKTKSIESRSFVNKKDGTRFLFIPEGVFLAGGSGADEGNGPFPVYLPAYYLAVFSVTNEQYSRFLSDANPRQADLEKWILMDAHCSIRKTKNGFEFDDDKKDHPVVQVSWYGANAYCEWAGLRLPTELEWEKGARGINGWEYPWGNSWDMDKCRNDWNKKDETTCSVDSYSEGKSPWGLYQMAGNVWEWCSDYYDPSAYARYRKGDFSPKQGDFRILRGGSWQNVTKENFRCAQRFNNNPTSQFNTYGFRCARSR